MSRFRAYRIHQRDGVIEPRLETLGIDELSDGDVVIRVSHSGINYKDALAATGAAPILRRFPLVGGIDLAGVVESSGDPAFHAGDAVLVTGCGLSETRDGGYAGYARVPATAVVPMPDGLDAAAAMALGTAGFAAALAIMRMQQMGQTPALGPVAVTGASGGVGSLAIDMLARAGYEPVAISGKAGAGSYLRELGAVRVLPRLQPGGPRAPLESACWGGAIDNVGGGTLAGLLAATRPFGNVASVGLAGQADVTTSVMPFILRGVNLLGVNSAATPRPLRLAVWQRLATDLRPRHLDRIVQRRVTLDELPAAFADYLRGRIVGRTVVEIG